MEKFPCGRGVMSIETLRHKFIFMNPKNVSYTIEPHVCVRSIYLRLHKKKVIYLLTFSTSSSCSSKDGDNTDLISWYLLNLVCLDR